MTNNRYYADRVDAEIREYSEIIADTLQNTAAETEEEARAIVDEAIENGELIEVEAKIDLVEEDSTEYPQWSEIEPETKYFATSEEAEKAAADLNRQAWAAWDEAHPDATKEEKMWAADHAPSFEATEM